MHKKELVTKQHIRKADILLIIFCLLSALLLGIWFLLGGKSGTTLQISYDGTLLYTANLKHYSNTGSQVTERAEQYCLITYSDSGSLPEVNMTFVRPDCPADTPYNLLCITDGTVTMEAADCRDQICVHHKPISGSRESIICLPHKLAVEITGDSEEDDTDTLDGMVK